MRGDAESNKFLALGEASMRVGAEITLRPDVFPEEEGGVVGSLLPLRRKSLRKGFFS